MAVDVKAKRIEIRVSEDERRLEIEAAEDLGLTLSEFVRQAARARAEEVIAERDARGGDVLPAPIAERLARALDEDRPPALGLRELFARPSAFE